MTQQDHPPQQPLDELQALIDKATPGPWHYGDEDERIVGGECVDIHAGEYCTESYRSVASAEGPFDGADFGPLDDESRANARLIALAPQLAAENISLRQEIQRLREALEQIGGLNGENYDSDRAWALAMQLRANTALRGWLSSQENKDDR